jgi:hypothetical protein
MFELFDEDLDNMELVEGALALNRAIDSDTNVHWAEQELARLLKEAELYLAHEADQEQKFESFLRLFFIRSGSLPEIMTPTFLQTMFLLIRFWNGKKVFLSVWALYCCTLAENWDFLLKVSPFLLNF